MIIKFKLLGPKVRGLLYGRHALFHSVSLRKRLIAAAHRGFHCMNMLQDKIIFRLKFFNLKVIFIFLCFLDLIHELLGLGDKEIENQPRLRNFNLNIIFTCNKYTKKYIYIQINCSKHSTETNRHLPEERKQHWKVSSSHHPS